MSSWLVASLLSALFLGFYEVCTKHAVHDNAVVPVLFLSTLTGAGVWAVLLLAQAAHPGAMPPWLVCDPLSPFQHLQIALKSAIVAASWIFTYFALRNLPLSLGSPIRATSPLWTLIGAVIILGERPTLLETIGILTTLISFVGLSVAGAKEGVHFHRDKWVAYLIAGTILGATSSLYDRYLLGRLHFSVPTVQAWFSVYLLVLFLPLAIGWQRRWWPRHEFRWRWSIPLIALFLLIADYIYFSALRHPQALVSVVMSLRRGSTLVGFSSGLLFFGEQHGLRKLPAVIGILLGMTLAVLGGT
jgi:drug/metabolite transporter (DMT)-like permease